MCGLLGIDDRGPVLPLAGERLLRCRRVGELLVSPVSHPELPCDRGLTVADRQQDMDGGVSVSGSAGEELLGCLAEYGLHP